MTDHDQADVDRHSALLHSAWGRRLVGFVLAVVAFFTFAPNMPGSPLRDDARSLWRPAEVAGFEQNWGVFSPNPRNQSLDVRAFVEFDDGSSEFWDVPEREPIIGALREYRWQKWQERVRLDDEEPLWEPTAAWIADQMQRDGELPVRVTLVRRWIDHAPLTADGVDDGGWNEFQYFVWERES